ncbi:unnamed protein product [Effrenium voratum]|nr:unnamed protein product [Effrenium voratum]
MEEALRQQQQQTEQSEARLEQRWHTNLKEESALRRAVESHLEARLVAMQREVRLEVGSAATQTQQVLSEFGHFRDSIRKELDMQKLEISSASADLSRLVDQLRNSGRGETVLAPSAESITESLVRAEVRRQLNERSAESASEANATAPALQAVVGRVDLLEKSLETETSSRQEESSKLLATLHELVAGGRQRQEEALQTLERRLQAQLDAIAIEARGCQQELAEEKKEWRQGLQQETKEREETCFAVLKSLEDKIASEQKNVQEQLTALQLAAQETSHRAEKQIQGSLESSVASFVERSSKELMTTRQDLLELREELQEVARTGKENLELAVTRLGRAAPEAQDSGVRPGVEDVQRLIDGQTKLREELWSDVDRVRNELRLEATARKEDVQGVRSSVDRIREQMVSHSSLGSGVSISASDDVLAALSAERVAREQGDERCLEEMRDMVREERQKREKDHAALELRMQSEEQTLFVESGKREERDRDILSQISSVTEDLDAVKRQITTGQQRKQLEEFHKVQDGLKQRVAHLEAHTAQTPVQHLRPTSMGGSGLSTPSSRPTSVGQMQWPMNCRVGHP